MCRSLKIEFPTAGPDEPDAGLLARLVHASPAVLYACKVADDFATIAVTGNAQRVLGYAPEEFTGDPGFWAVRIHPEDAARVVAAMPCVFALGRHEIEYRFQHADGNYRWLRDQMSLERDAHGRPQRLLGSWTEVAGPRPGALVNFGNDLQTTTAGNDGGKNYAKQT